MGRRELSDLAPQDLVLLVDWVTPFCTRSPDRLHVLPRVQVGAARRVSGLAEERLSLDDVMEEARSNEIESVDEIRFAVVEASGRMSFFKA